MTTDIIKNISRNMKSEQSYNNDRNNKLMTIHKVANTIN